MVERVELLEDCQSLPPAPIKLTSRIILEEKILESSEDEDQMIVEILPTPK
jgi:hypothetical protein